VYRFKTVIKKLKKENMNVPQHINSAVKCKSFGTVNIQFHPDEGYDIAIRRHNVLVDENGHVLKKITDCKILWCSQVYIMWTH
jgi:hypothetical protein